MGDRSGFRPKPRKGENMEGKKQKEWMGTSKEAARREVVTNNCYMGLRENSLARQDGDNDPESD
jgi:hypothetical protein